MGLLIIFQQNLQIYHRNDSTSLCTINFIYILVLEDVIGSDVGGRFLLAHLVHTVWVKKVAPSKTFCNIFTRVKYISVKFCQYVDSLYIHIPTNFGRFVLIFNKTALIFLGVLIIFHVSSFEFHQVKCQWWVASVHPTSTHWIIRLGGNARVLLQAATEAKTVPKFTESL